MYKVTVGKDTFDIESKDEKITINDKPLNWDTIRIKDGYFHILHDHISYRAEVVKTDFTTKTFIIKLNGKNFTVSLKDKFDLLLEKLGMDNVNSNKINSIKAPMPGLIIDLKIKVGDEVKQNDPLLILEAMKMENVIKAPGDAAIKAVNIKKGDSVEKNQVLIEFK
jgi:biotin carboxyl carrier protein